MDKMTEHTVNEWQLQLLEEALKNISQVCKTTAAEMRTSSDHAIAAGRSCAGTVGTGLGNLNSIDQLIRSVAVMIGTMRTEEDEEGCDD